MKLRFLTAAAAVLFTAVLCGAAGPEVLLNEKDVYISHKKIYLKDVARVKNAAPEDRDKLNALYLKRAAVPGYSVTVTKRLVYNVVKKHFRYVSVSGHDRVKVHTEKEIISRAEIEEKALEYIYENMPWKKEETTVKIRMRENDVPVIKGSVLLKIKEDKKPVFKGNVIIPVGIYVDGRFYKIEPVTADIEVNTECYAASGSIKRHSAVDKSMVKPVKMNITRVPGDVITDLSSLKNMVTNRAIMEGVVLTKAMFEKVPLFRRGDTVGVIAVVRGVAVESAGEALSDGYEGDDVKVDLVTGKTVEGVVNRYGKVVIIKEKNHQF